MPTASLSSSHAAPAPAPAPAVPHPAIAVISVASANTGWTPGDRVEEEEVATASFAAAANTSCNYAPTSVDVDAAGRLQ